MRTAERVEDGGQPPASLIIVGVDESAEAEAAAAWAVREADLRKDDVLLVNAYDVPLLPANSLRAVIAQARQERQALLDKVAATLAIPPPMHFGQLVEVDSPESLLPRLSANAELTVLGQDHRRLPGDMALGHTANTIASLSLSSSPRSLPVLSPWRSLPSGDRGFHLSVSVGGCYGNDSR